MREKLNITAHSGCDGTPDDSLESIEAGIRYGADLVEVDIRCNKDGVLILSHDEDSSREYRSHPALAAAFEMIARNGKAAVNCDVKELDTVPAILSLAEKAGLGPDRLIFTGDVTPAMVETDEDMMKRAQVWPGILEVITGPYRNGENLLKPFAPLIDPAARGRELLPFLESHSEAMIQSIIKRCLSLGLRALNMPYLEQTVALIPALLQNGLQASVWTINTEKDLERLFALGIVNVTTRNTRLAVEVREKG